jgi:hypothetical protein
MKSRGIGCAWAVVLAGMVTSLNGCRSRTRDPDEPVQNWKCVKGVHGCECSANYKGAGTCGKWDCCYYVTHLQLMDATGAGDECYCVPADSSTGTCPPPSNKLAERQPTCP